MKQVTAPRSARSSQARVRELGFDPAHLTIEEQQELLELHERLEAGPPRERPQPLPH